MSNALAVLPKDFGQVATLPEWQNIPAESLGGGITGGYAVMGYRGKVWSIRKGGEEYPLMADFNGQQIPLPALDAVIVKAAGVISKVWYENGYQEGSSASPDCMSTNGVTPSPMSPKRQSAACGVCPRNQFRTKENGKKGKECQDSKRTAITPLNDLTNDSFGGPMLLRVPAASLNPLKLFGDAMAKRGFPLYFSYGVRIAFDPQESYPKFVFSPIRALDKNEAMIVQELRNDPSIDRIIAEEQGDVSAPVQGGQSVGWLENHPANGMAGSPTAPNTNGQHATPAAQKATKPKTTAAKAPKPEPAVEPAQASGQDFDGQLDDLLEGDE
jgi:hypothetical protein